MAHLSWVRLLQGVPLTPDYQDTFAFSSQTEQETYFIGKTKYTYTDCMYVKDDYVIVPSIADYYRDCNYIMWRQHPDEFKTHYGFITRVEYISDSSTRIYYKEDFLQSWFYDMSPKQCFVEREHANTDVPGDNLLDDGLAYGDYVTNSFTEQYFTDWWFIVVTSVLFSGQGFPPAEGYLYGNMYSGLAYYAYDTSDLGNLAIIIEGLAAEGKSDAIVSIYMVPKVTMPGQSSGSPLNVSSFSLSVPIPNSGTIDGYTPTNKKLLTYPFRACRISNNAGGSVSLRYELLGNLFASITGRPFPNSRLLIYPSNYAGRENNLDYSVNIGDYPQCAWNKDVYTNWLTTQNIKWDYEGERRLVNSGVTVAKDSATAIGNLLSGNTGGVGTVINDLINAGTAEYNARSLMSQEKEMFSVNPPSAKGSVGNENLLMNIGKYGFVIEERTITASYAKSIDDYWTAFGYPARRVKTPNIYGRASFNFVKTINAVVTGNAPTEALELYKGLLNKGIRFWHTQDLGNYSLSNAITG